MASINLPIRPLRPPPHTATHRTLHLPELLELILLFLPQKDILLSQRTSRTFRHTVLGSSRLQRALFLAPDWRHSTSNPQDPTRTGRKPENNRLLLRAFPGCYPTVTLVIVNDAPTPLERKIGRVGSEHWSWDVCISFPATGIPETKAAVLFPEASWRRMFLSQPPCTSLHLVRRWRRSLLPAIVRLEGIRMGEFVEEVLDRGLEGENAGDGGAGVGKVWERRFVSSDRDWHFEGNIRCSTWEVEDEGG